MKYLNYFSYLNSELLINSQTNPSSTVVKHAGLWGMWCSTIKTQSRQMVYNMFSETKLEQSNCSKKTADEQNTNSAIAGIQLLDIEEIPDLSVIMLNEPNTIGIMLEIIADIIKPIHVRLDDHEKLLKAPEEKNESTATKVAHLEKDGKNTLKKLGVCVTQKLNTWKRIIICYY